MINRPNIAITMTFRDKKILKFFKERCSNTKFDKAWAVRNIFEDYFDRIKNNPDILAFEIDETSFPIKYGIHKEKAVIKVCIFNPDAVKFLKDINTKNGRAFFVKNVILLYFYNRKAYDEPEVFIEDKTNKTNPPNAQNNIQADISGVQEKKERPANLADISGVLKDF